MPEAAAAYTRAHHGQCFEITVLAAFCLGMRRALIEEVGLLDERFEIGTAVGYSGIWLAGALPAGGMLLTMEVDPQRARTAR